jgi:hypothetical protein
VRITSIIGAMMEAARTFETSVNFWLHGALFQKAVIFMCAINEKLGDYRKKWNEMIMYKELRTQDCKKPWFITRNGGEIPEDI